MSVLSTERNISSVPVSSDVTLSHDPRPISSFHYSRWEFIKEKFEEKIKKTRFQPRKKVRFKKKERKHTFDQEKN